MGKGHPERTGLEYPTFIDLNGKDTLMCCFGNTAVKHAIGVYTVQANVPTAHQWQTSFNANTTHLG